METFRKKIKKTGITFKDLNISSKTGFFCVNGKEFGNIAVNFVMIDYNELISTPGWGKYINLFDKGQICQFLIIFFEETPWITVGNFSAGIENQQTVNKLNNEFIKDQAEKTLLRLNKDAAEISILNKYGPAYELISYLKRCKEMMSENRILEKVGIIRPIYRALLPALADLDLIETNGRDAKFIGPK